jgi:hypothetical protein
LGEAEALDQGWQGDADDAGVQDQDELGDREQCQRRTAVDSGGAGTWQRCRRLRVSPPGTVTQVSQS